MAATNLSGVTQRLAYAIARGSDEALDLVDLANRIAPPQALVPMRVDDFDAAVQSLLRSLQARQRAMDARTAAARLAELSDELGAHSRYSLQDFAAQMADRAERITLLAQSGDLEAAARAANEGLAWLGDERLSDTPPDVLFLELRGDLLWAAADAFGNNDIFVEAMRATATALTRSADFPETANPGFQDHLALKLAERALVLTDAGLHPEHNLAQARTALSWLSDAGGNKPSGMNRRLRWAVAAANYEEAADILRAADTAGLTDLLDMPLQRRAAVELLSSWPTADAWLLEFGPFAAPLYAEARGVTLSEAYDFLGEQPPTAGHGDDTWPPHALTVGQLVLTDADIDLAALARHQGLSTATPTVRSVPTASLLTYLDSSSADPGLAPWIAVGSQAASVGEAIHHQVAAMLAYFDRHSIPTEASFTCAAVLAGVATKLLGPVACVSYAGHLTLTNHDVAFSKALRDVPAPTDRGGQTEGRHRVLTLRPVR